MLSSVSVGSVAQNPVAGFETVTVRGGSAAPAAIGPRVEQRPTMQLHPDPGHGYLTWYVDDDRTYAELVPRFGPSL